ncbi:Bifunctional protein Aas [Corynebacterium gerontici]|uniref:Bifunctional protein Aas n=1 Tax=Corynebacterium gerontici TaxID=2079234 RepID=A0A3G6J2Q7_9CORY|nr:Bifunctional protein Aas [Corynebacterium gerontici]
MNLARALLHDSPAPALLSHGRCLSHAELREEVIALAETLRSPHRLLVQVPFERSVEAIIGYLSVLEAGHVALLAGDDASAPYRPNAVMRGKTVVTLHRDPIELHPELTVLLSTSGSTGSSKLVRLSAENLISNAEAIIDGLGLEPFDVAATLLPLHYSFGLSVLHTHLRLGAAVAVGEWSIADTDLHTNLAHFGVTNFGVVPHMLQLAQSNPTLDPAPQHLRLLYQAGGKLDAQAAQIWSQRLGKQGIAFSMMYGQTEASARMTITPPSTTLEDPRSVGRVIRGSTMEVRDGELVFTGPGVMLGYAMSQDDLALGRMITELRTGDLGRIQNGVVFIEGRRNDFLKIAGLRISLPQIQERLNQEGVHAIVTGDDEAVRILATRDTTTDTRTLIRATGLDGAHVRTATTKALPLLPNGKPDKRKAAGIVDKQWAGAETLPKLAHLLGIYLEDVDVRKSFVENGGTSLNHVAAASLLGRRHALPPNWHHVPLEQILGSSGGARADMSMVLRAFAALTIVFNHAKVLQLLGGAHTLLLVAGYQLASFAFGLPSRRARVARVARTCLAVGLPTALVALIGVLITGTYGWSNVFLVEWLWESPGSTWLFWFIETYLVGMVVVTAISCVPAWWRLYARDAFAASLVLLGLLLVPRYLVAVFDPDHLRHGPLGAMWLIAVGVLLRNALSRAQQVLAWLLCAIPAWGMFATPWQWLYVVAGAGLLLWVPQVRVPRWALAPLGLLAAASLYSYILQFDILARIESPWLGIVVSLAAGIACWWLVQQVVGCVWPRLRRRADRRVERGLHTHDVGGESLGVSSVVGDEHAGHSRSF